MEKKYTQEEITAIADEAIRKANLKSGRELDLDEMEKVSGGAALTHQEIDEKCDAVQLIMDEYGLDVGQLMAEKLGIAMTSSTEQCSVSATGTPAAASIL